MDKMAKESRAAASRPNRAQARSEEIWKEIADDLVDRLQRGDLQWSSGWTASDRPVNPTTGSGYKGTNNLMLRYIMWCRGTGDPRFCGFEQAKSKGWSIRKGAEGIPLRRYIETLRDPSGRPVAGQGKMTTREKHDYLAMHEGSRITSSFKFVYVFSALDIDGIAPYTQMSRKQIDDKTVDLLISASPCAVKEVADAIPCYSRVEDAIRIPRRNQFDSIEHLATTLLHEQMHSTGHQSRLDRPVHKEWGDDIYAREELIAELGSALAFSELGLLYPKSDIRLTDEVRDNTSAYLASWASALEDPVEEVRAAFSDAARGASLICERNEEIMRSEHGIEIEVPEMREAPVQPAASLASLEHRARVAADSYRNHADGRSHGAIEVEEL